MLDNFQPSTEYTHTRYIEFARLAKCLMNYSCNSDVKHLMSTVLCSYLFILLLSYVLTQQQPNVVLKSVERDEEAEKSTRLAVNNWWGKNTVSACCANKMGLFSWEIFLEIDSGLFLDFTIIDFLQIYPGMYVIKILKLFLA